MTADPAEFSIDRMTSEDGLRQGVAGLERVIDRLSKRLEDALLGNAAAGKRVDEDRFDTGVSSRRRSEGVNAAPSSARRFDGRPSLMPPRPDTGEENFARRSEPRPAKDANQTARDNVQREIRDLLKAIDKRLELLAANQRAVFQ